jgi:diamine N-acetyltransferase
MELATFEKSGSAVKTSAVDLERDGFETEPPYFQCIVAVAPGAGNPAVVGYLLYYTTYSSWVGKALQLKDVYVTPGYQNRGIGFSLLQTLARTAVDGGFSRITLEIFAWNLEARRFYEKWGAVNVTESEERLVFRFPGEALPGLAMTI